MGLVGDLNPGPRAPEARIIPQDQRADIALKPRHKKYWKILIIPPFTYIFHYYSDLLTNPSSAIYFIYYLLSR